jgi:hypothetical protein
MHKTFSQYLYEQKFKLIEFDKDSKKSDEKSINSDNKDEKDIKQDEKTTDEGDDKKSSDDKKDDEKNKKENPDKQGVLRKIQNAHLIYKRQDIDGTYTELWAYDIQKGLKDEFNIRNAILNGTDIDHKTGSSPDNVQRYELWTSVPRQFMQITGLPN